MQDALAWMRWPKMTNNSAIECAKRKPSWRMDVFALPLSYWKYLASMAIVML